MRYSDLAWVGPLRTNDPKWPELSGDRQKQRWSFYYRVEGQPDFFIGCARSQLEAGILRDLTAWRLKAKVRPIFPEAFRSITQGLIDGSKPRLNDLAALLKIN